MKSNAAGLAVDKDFPFEPHRLELRFHTFFDAKAVHRNKHPLFSFASVEHIPVLPTFKCCKGIEAFPPQIERRSWTTTSKTSSSSSQAQQRASAKRWRSFIIAKWPT